MFDFFSFCTSRKKTENLPKEQEITDVEDDNNNNNSMTIDSEDSQDSYSKKNKMNKNSLQSFTHTPNKLNKINTSNDGSQDNNTSDESDGKNRKKTSGSKKPKKALGVLPRKLRCYNMQEWKKVLEINDFDNTSLSEISNSLKIGIPDSLRPEIWDFITNINDLINQHKPDTYSRLISKPSKSDKYIERDLDRTYPSEPYFRDPKNRASQRLYNVLRAYSNYDEEIGYTQGANFIAGILLMILNPENYPENEYNQDYTIDYEEKSFWFLLYITHTRNWRQVFKSGTPKVIEMTKFFGRLLKSQARDVYYHIRQHPELTIGCCFDQMMITLLIYNTPLEISKRVLDIFFLEGEAVLFNILLQAIKLCHEEIMNLRTSEVNKII